MKTTKLTWRLNYHGDDPGDASESVSVTTGRIVICDPNEICDFFNEPSEIAKYMADNGVLMWNDTGGSVFVIGSDIYIGSADDVGYSENIIVDEIGGDCGATIAFSIDGIPSALMGLIPKGRIINGVPNGIYRPYVCIENEYIKKLAK